MNFLEAVYSYVFGDGDPNADVDKKQIAAAADAIRKSGGAVVAEQLAPYLALPPSENADDLIEEGYVLPGVAALDAEAHGGTSHAPAAWVGFHGVWQDV